MLLSDPIQGYPAFCSTTDTRQFSITSSSAVPGFFLQPWAVPGAGKKGTSTSRELLCALTLLSSSTLPLTPQMLFMTLVMYLACKRPYKENTPRYQILKAEWEPTMWEMDLGLTPQCQGKCCKTLFDKGKSVTKLELRSWCSLGQLQQKVKVGFFDQGIKSM